jgi:hypothetical protein
VRALYRSSRYCLRVIGLTAPADAAEAVRALFDGLLVVMSHMGGSSISSSAGTELQAATHREAYLATTGRRAWGDLLRSHRVAVCLTAPD